MAGERFKPDEANFLAHAAADRRLVTYGEMSKRFGRANQGWGGPLTQMGQRLKAHGLPLLPVLVVTQGTTEPSPDAAFYKALGLGPEEIAAEQRRCFDYDWSKAAFWKDPL